MRHLEEKEREKQIKEEKENKKKRNASSADAAYALSAGGRGLVVGGVVSLNYSKWRPVWRLRGKGSPYTRQRMHSLGR